MDNDKALIDSTYKRLSPRADLVYSFISIYNDYIHEARDYGTGIVINMVEVHTLTMIVDNPGITVSQLSGMWMRTKSAVSQNVSKLEQKGLIYRQQDAENKKIMHLFATEKGEILSTAHKHYDNEDIAETYNDLLKSCTKEEIDIFYKVLGEYYKLF